MKPRHEDPEQEPLSGLLERADRPVSAPASAPLPLSPQELRTLVHELEVHRIELEMQNDELRGAQRALELSRERYVDLYDLAPAAYVTLGRHGGVLNVNLTGAALLGIARAQLVGQPFVRFVLRKDHAAFFEHLRCCIDLAQQATCEFTLLCDGGKQLPVQLHSVPVQTSNPVHPGHRQVMIAAKEFLDTHGVRWELKFIAYCFSFM